MSDEEISGDQAFKGVVVVFFGIIFLIALVWGGIALSKVYSV